MISRSAFYPNTSSERCTVLLLVVLILVGCGGEEPGEVSLQLEFATSPPAEQPAGEPFAVETALIDEAGEDVEEAGVEVELILNQHQFDDGKTTVAAESDDSGVADFELNIEKADRDYELTANIIDDSATVTETFAVVAAHAHEDMASNHFIDRFPIRSGVL